MSNVVMMLPNAARPRSHPWLVTDRQGLVGMINLSENQLEILPVVSRTGVRKLEGIVTLWDVLNSYGVSPPERTNRGAVK
jgi:CBS domain-containing protein